MPPKGKKKRASLHLDPASGQIKDKGESTPVRQVVEVVDDAELPEKLETIQKEAEEIEDSAQTIREEVTEELEKSELNEEKQGSVESLFTKSTSPVTPEITVVSKKKTSVGVWIGAVLGAVLAVGASLLLFVRGPSTFSLFSVKPTPTPTETPVPTATPVSVVDRSTVIVFVVNGGGTPGAASKMKAFLEDKGYKVSGVSNADEYTYEETQINVKSGKTAVAALLKEDLKSDYTIASETATVEDSASYDAQVIVGK